MEVPPAQQGPAERASASPEFENAPQDPAGVTFALATGRAFEVALGDPSGKEPLGWQRIPMPSVPQVVPGGEPRRRLPWLKRS